MRDRISFADVKHILQYVADHLQDTDPKEAKVAARLLDEIAQITRRPAMRHLSNGEMVLQIVEVEDGGDANP